MTANGTVRAYERISVITEESSRIDRDRDDIGDWANFARKGWPIEHYTDKGISGAKGERLKERQRLLADLRAGDVLAATTIDRLARNLNDLLDILKHVEQVGATAVFTKQGISTEGLYGGFSIKLLGLVAELERDIIAERHNAAYKHNLATGRYGSGRLPFGWHAVKDPDKNRLVVRPIKDEGPCERCRDKNDQPVAHRADGVRLREAILNVIGGATFASQARALGLETTAFYWLVRNTRLYGLPPDEGAVEDPESAIITKAQWLALQHRLNPRGPGTWTLTPGIGPALFCHHCDQRMHLDIADGKYKCRRRDLHADPKTRRPAIKRSIADDYVINYFIDGYGDKPVMRQVHASDSKRRELLAEIEIELEATTDALRTPGVDIPALTQRIQELHQERDAAESMPADEAAFELTGQSTGSYFMEAGDEARVNLINQVMRVVIHTPNRDGGRIEVRELQPSKTAYGVTLVVPSDSGVAQKRL